LNIPDNFYFLWGGCAPVKRFSELERLGAKLRKRGACASSYLEALSIASLSKSLFTESPDCDKVSSKWGF